MDYSELNTKYLQVFDFISERRISDALDRLGLLCNNCRNRDLRVQLEKHAETYLNMLKYSFELTDDPQKENVYSRLIRGIMGLADDIREDIIRSNNLLRYYNLKLMPETVSEQYVAESVKIVEKLLLQTETRSKGEDVDPRLALLDSKPYKDSMKMLYRIIWLADKLKDSEIELLERISNPGTIAWYHKCTLMSALTLSLIRHFDSKKVDLLFKFYETEEKQVWQRALAGIILGLAYYDNRLEFYPEILQRLKAIQGLKSANKAIEIIIIQFLKARDTEKIARKIQQEIIPEMIKIKSKLEEKLDLDNLLKSESMEEKNPEWEIFFKESPDVYNKLQEFTNLQMEGADVFLSAFAMLKQFDFFNEIENWFMPFYKGNDYVAESFRDISEDFDVDQFIEGLERSNFLCNSDKYSFCLNIRHMPSFQKSTVIELFNMELKAMNELASSDEIINAEAQTKGIVTQYFHDLYRFFKLHPFKAEYEDLFKMSKAVYETRFFRSWIDDANVLRNIGEFFFEKGHYTDAITIFRQLVESAHNYELFEKIAYSYQQLEDYDAALDYYHKAELLGKERLWLINRIAFCYRRTGNYKNAVEYYTHAEKLEPDNLQVQAFLGQAYMEMENYEEALKYYFKVEYLQPDNHKVKRPISWCSFMLGRLDTARKYLEKSMVVEATKHDYLNMAHIFWCQGNKPQAIKYYRSALEAANLDSNWFSRIMKDDSKYLILQGIHEFDVPLMIDYILLSFRT
jgi:tetratricopeptide (TPR) repeat protein